MGKKRMEHPRMTYPLASATYRTASTEIKNLMRANCELFEAVTPEEFAFQLEKLRTELFAIK
jgi:hypothetical protein